MVSLLRYFRLASNSIRAYGVFLEGGVGADYSTNEATTGGTWVDGKEIFQKSVLISAGPFNETLNIPHGASIDSLIDFQTVVTNGTLWRQLNNPEADPVQLWLMAVDATNLINVSGVGGDYSAYSGYCTLRYTKT